MNRSGCIPLRTQAREYVATVLTARSCKACLFLLIFITTTYGLNVMFKNEVNLALPPISGSGMASPQDSNVVQILMSNDDVNIPTVKRPPFAAPPLAAESSTPLPTSPQAAPDESAVPKHLAQQRLLDCLTTGEWHREPYTKEQEEEMKVFLRKTRNQYNLPVPLQRNDGRCGGITFPELMWFRAVCDPYGATPCCVQGICQNKTTQECVCDTCYDLRQRLYAELSTWTNRDANCQVSQYSPKETCSILDGGNFYFIGDSHIRHMYMGLQILLTGDHELGCMGRNISAELRAECFGLYMFTEKVCRKKVLSTMSVCGGRVHLHLAELYSTAYAARILKAVTSMIGKPGSVLVIGLGHHDSFHPGSVIPKVASPVIDLVEKSGQIWPKIIWIGAHSMGLLKTPSVPNHLNPSVLNLNRVMRNFLKAKRINFLNTFNLTLGISSPDGSHYGKGANLLKARVFVDYLRRVGGVNAISQPYSEPDKYSINA